MRNLKCLGFRVPLAIVNKAHTANQLYPFAISLIESVRTYERTLEKVRISTDSPLRSQLQWQGQMSGSQMLQGDESDAVECTNAC